MTLLGCSLMRVKSSKTHNFSEYADSSLILDEFENISEDYEKFSEHRIPGGLKVCLVTEFGRSLR